MAMVQPLPVQPDAVDADVAAVRAAQLDAARLLASKAAGSVSAQEAKDFAQASFALSQAVVVLDPTLDQQGIPLEHHAALEQQKQDGQERLEKARQAAAPPSPARRKLGIKRDSGGRLSGIEEE